MTESVVRCTAFAGDRRIASGDLQSVAVAGKTALDRGDVREIRVFDDDTGRTVELDLIGTVADVAERYRDREASGSSEDAHGKRRGPGRPKLGVVAKEVTLLPRHWAWLQAQRGSASATLRRLVDQARREHEQRDRVRRAQDATYRFMHAVGGNLPGFEEAVRALYSGARSRFDEMTSEWPQDLRAHSRRLAQDAFPEDSEGAVP